MADAAVPLTRVGRRREVRDAMQRMFSATEGGTTDDPAALVSAADAFAREIGYVKTLPIEAQLRKLRLDVAEVVDVGVRYGTRFLYKSFPDAAFVLVDPQRGGEALLRERPRSYRFLNVGVSDAPGTLVLNEEAGRSSYLQRAQEVRGAVELPTHETPVTTLDQILERETKSDRIGIKIDVEGFEDRVVRGLEKHAHRVVFLIAEVSVLRRFEESYMFSDVVALLRERGLYFYGILNPSQVPSPRHYDVLFLRRDDPSFLVRRRGAEPADRA